MAVRKSALAAEARRAASMRAAKFMAREQQLLDVAADYATAEAELEAVAERFARRREELDREQEAAEQVARAQASASARRMIDLGVGKREAAERLGITAAQLKEALRETGPASGEPVTNNDGPNAVTEVPPAVEPAPATIQNDALVTATA